MHASVHTVASGLFSYVCQSGRPWRPRLGEGHATSGCSCPPCSFSLDCLHPCLFPACQPASACRTNLASGGTQESHGEASMRSFVVNLEPRAIVCREQSLTLWLLDWLRGEKAGSGTYTVTDRLRLLLLRPLNLVLVSPSAPSPASRLASFPTVPPPSASAPFGHLNRLASLSPCWGTRLKR